MLFAPAIGLVAYEGSDPHGVEQRKHGHLHRRMYVSPGANFCWHINGYDKLKPFGFSIHGCVDGFSKRIIWLEVRHQKKNPQLIAQYFLRSVKGALMDAQYVAEDAIKIRLSLKLKFPRRKIKQNCPVSKVKFKSLTMFSVLLSLR